MQQIVDKTIMEADKDGDGKLSFEEFTTMVANTVSASDCGWLIGVDAVWMKTMLTLECRIL